MARVLVRRVASGLGRQCEHHHPERSVAAVGERLRIAATQRLDVDVRSAAGVRLEVVATASAAEIEVEVHPSGRLWLREEAGAAEVGLEEGVTKAVVVRLPQRVASCRLASSGTAWVRGKLEAIEAICVESTAGDVVLETARATKIRVDAAGGVRCTKLVEGASTSIAGGGDVALAKLQATEAWIQASGLDVTSAYCGRLRCTVASDARFDTAHGRVEATVAGDCRVERLTGSASVAAGSADVAFDSIAQDSDLRANGDLTIRLSAEDTVDVELEAPEIRVPTALSVVRRSVGGGSTLCDDASRSRIAGHLAPTFSTPRQRGAGKIHIAHAHRQRFDSAVSSSAGKNNTESPRASTLRAASSAGVLTLAEPLSWIDSIRRNVGLQPFADLPFSRPP